MPFRSTKKYLQYKFDTLMSKGVISLISGLFFISVIFVFIIAIIGALLGINNSEAITTSFWDLVWSTVLHSLDGGVISSNKGNWMFMTLMFIATLGGMVLISILIGVLNSGIAKQLENLRKGRSLVIEKENKFLNEEKPKPKKRYYKPNNKKK